MKEGDKVKILVGLFKNNFARVIQVKELTDHPNEIIVRRMSPDENVLIYFEHELEKVSEGGS
jgi:transcription antitermination factor NusG